MALLNADGEVIGSVCAFDKADGSPFTDTDRDRLVVLAQTASVALQNAIAHQEVVDLARRLAGIQEAQRRSIALELHDEIGQALTALGLQLNYARAATDDPQLRSALGEALATCEATLERVRALSLELRPPLLDELGLEAALRWYMEHQAQRRGITTRIETDAVGARVSPEIATACFRIAQEGLTNTVRHASAKSVGVSLRLRDDDLSLVIEDDGMGFDVPAARERSRKGVSLGLLGMQDHAVLTGGRLDITSAPGRGTQICAQWSLTPRPFAGGPRGRL
jgi:signal transduction histidine kinase